MDDIISESQLGPNGLKALKLIRALRELPNTEATYRAESYALRNIGVTDLRIVAMILHDEAAAERRRG
jgi:hypothetical protein